MEPLKILKNVHFTQSDTHRQVSQRRVSGFLVLHVRFGPHTSSSCCLHSTEPGWTRRRSHTEVDSGGNPAGLHIAATDWLSSAHRRSQDAVLEALSLGVRRETTNILLMLHKMGIYILITTLYKDYQLNKSIYNIIIYNIMYVKYFYVPFVFT